MEEQDLVEVVEEGVEVDLTVVGDSVLLMIFGVVSSLSSEVNTYHSY